MSAGLLGTAASGASAPAPHSPTTDGDFAILVRVPSSKLGPAESVMIDLTRLTSRAPGRDGALEKGGDSIPVSEEEDDWTYPDGGWRAWGVVLGCFLYAATTMAFGLTWGVFAESFLVNETFGKNVSPATINTVQGLANFSATSIAFIAGRLGDRYGYKRMIASKSSRPPRMYTSRTDQCTVGSILSFLSLIASSFSTSLVELFLFQGAALGLSGGLSFPLVISLPSQWFQRRRGLATGIAISGSGIGGAALAAIVRAMLPRVGYRNVYLILAFVHGLLFIVAWFLLEVRERPLRDGKVKVPRDWLPSGVWRDVAFYAISLSVLLSIFGYLVRPLIRWHLETKTHADSLLLHHVFHPRNTAGTRSKGHHDCSPPRRNEHQRRRRENSCRNHCRPTR